jgi:hypothetical protein
MTKAKSKSKTKKAAKKDTKNEIAGVKVPKAVAESGPFSALGAMFNSALGREILADALIAAAGAAAAALTRTRGAKNAGAAVADAGASAANATSEAAQTAAGAVAGVVTEAARNFLPASLTGGADDRDRGEPQEGKPRYVNLASDHSSRRKSPGERVKPSRR